MRWYHWIAVYMVILAGIIFTIIPEKPWWLWLSIIGGGYTGYWMITRLPGKVDKYVDKEG